MIHDPYLILGVARSTPLDAVEVAYKAMLREHHPDLHQSEGPEAVAAAQTRTQQITEAMERIRVDHHRARRHGRDWQHRRPNPTSDAAPCPYCDASFTRLKDFSEHLATAHKPVFGRPPGRREPLLANNGLIQLLGKARYIPAPLAALAFWYLFLTAFRQPAIWGSAMVLLLLVLWAQTSKLFKRRL